MPSKNQTPTQVSQVRRAAKNVLYTIANSNAMNYDIVGYSLAPWKNAMIAIDCSIVGALMIWGAIVIYLGLKKKKEE